MTLFYLLIALDKKKQSNSQHSLNISQSISNVKNRHCPIYKNVLQNSSVDVLRFYIYAGATSKFLKSCGNSSNQSNAIFEQVIFKGQCKNVCLLIKICQPEIQTVKGTRKQTNGICTLLVWQYFRSMNSHRILEYSKTWKVSKLLLI